MVLAEHACQAQDPGLRVAGNRDRVGSPPDGAHAGVDQAVEDLVRVAEPRALVHELGDEGERPARRQVRPAIGSADDRDLGAFARHAQKGVGGFTADRHGRQSGRLYLRYLGAGGLDDTRDDLVDRAHDPRYRRVASDDPVGQAG